MLALARGEGEGDVAWNNSPQLHCQDQCESIWNAPSRQRANMETPI